MTHRMIRHIHHFTIDGHFGCFQVGAITNKAATNFSEYVFWCTCVQLYVGYKPRSCISGL